MKAKVFGIGMMKTGTSTLGTCFEQLGYKRKSFDLEAMRKYFKQNYEYLFEITDQYDALEDLPWLMMYEELDKKYPNSKFILTVRKSSETWYKSFWMHLIMMGGTFELSKLKFGKLGAELEKKKGKQKVIALYEAHNKAVTDYFADSPDKLLTICWDQEDGWQRLCDFLGKKIPPNPFPHSNKTKNIFYVYTQYVQNRVSKLFSKYFL
ncbi:MAG: hypothetical protein ACI85I_001460 [Arenicella sp.]|jgi:hypothetical protein